MLLRGNSVKLRLAVALAKLLDISSVTTGPDDEFIDVVSDALTKLVSSEMGTIGGTIEESAGTVDDCADICGVSELVGVLAADMDFDGVSSAVRIGPASPDDVLTNGAAELAGAEVCTVDIVDAAGFTISTADDVELLGVKL